LRLLECYPVISGFSTRYQHRSHYHFSVIFKMLASVLPSAKLPPGSDL